MEIIEAGLLDFPKADSIIVDDRRLFDNPIFAKGAPPSYTTWRGCKRVVKYLIAVLGFGSHVFFLMDGKRVAGAAVVVRKNYIDAFFINKEYRNRGHGRELMEHVLGFIARRSPEAEVRVEWINPGAREFYERCGFSVKAYIMEARI